ncbi:hypothetical protein LENED_005626 [Lentinula edodes]|uniref:CENP-C homolog n=1 Tax=Lentinula edodes TaxID=5353 RepID=A0A1Q3E9G7_LENED|nr:hypothetical protein LENED_005626 [Lentinula edodes]
MSSSSETTVTPTTPRLEINTSEETLSSSSHPTTHKGETSENEEEHEPDTPTSSSSSSTSSFTTVTADMSSSTAEIDASISHKPTSLSDSSNSSLNSSMARVSSAGPIVDQPTATSSSKSAPPTPPKTTKRRSRASVTWAPFPEQGWDDNTPTNGNVLDFRTEKPVSRRITHTEKLISHSLRVAYEGNWSFSKVFADGSFMASGYIHLPVGGRKSSKSVKDNTYIFHVVEGAVNVKIHDTAYIIAQGGSFMVPRGNVYFIENICERAAKLMFVQAREVTAGEQDDPLRLEFRAVEESVA